MKIKVLVSAAVLFLSLLTSQSVKAQSGTNSPYSQFGLGMLADQSSGFNRGMNGLGVSLHDHDKINYLNPASYSGLDSLTFIFDIGMSGQITNFEENGVKKNAKNADFEYVVGGFRILKNLGLGFGLIPYTNIGYSFSSSEKLSDSNSTTSYSSYSGSGGLHQIFLGVGYSPIKGLSVGVNGSYLYGDYSRSVANSYSNSYVNSLMKVYTADVRSYKLEGGVQYSFMPTKKDEVTVGATYSYGHKIGGEPTLQVISSNSQTSVSDTTTLGGSSLKLEIPTVISAGISMNHNNKWRIGVDYSLQKWGKVENPEFKLENGVNTYKVQSGLYKDRHKVTVGGEYCPNLNGRKFVNRIRYRAGVSYATPYYYINGNDGPKEYSASIGVGVPIMNSWNNRSMLNVSAQWVHQSAKNYITENTFRINVGITFNERWFAKWKVE